MIMMLTVWMNPTTSKVPSSVRYLSRLIEARLHALLSRCMYSEQGLLALMRSVLAQVCQSLMVVSYCMPGSPHCHAASAIHDMTSFAFRLSTGFFVVIDCSAHSPSFSTASRKSSVTRTELLAF